MSAPTINHNLTTFNDASTDPGTGWGQNSGKWDVETEIYREGSSSLGCTPNATGDGGNGYTGTSFDATARLILVWVYVVTPGFANTLDNYGVYIRIGSSTSWTDYVYDYKVGGSDVAWTGKGWHLVVLDANRTQDRQPGANAPTLTAITRVGVGFTITTTSSKSTAMAIDAIRHGTSFEVTGSIATTGVNLAFTASTKTITRASGDFSSDGYASGDPIYVRGSTSNDGRFTVNTVGTTTMTVLEDLVDESSASGRTIDAAVTWADVISWDEGTSTYNYGVVTRNTLGSIELNFPVTLGDVSGSNRLVFETLSPEVVYFTDQAMDPGTQDLRLITAEDTGAVTRVFFGQSTGAGDSRVGFGGVTYIQDRTVFSGEAWLDFDAAITELGIFGSTLSELKGSSTFPASSGSYYIATSSFSGCGQVDLGRAQTRGAVFTGYDGTTDGALLWNENIDIKNSRFLSNTRGIEHPSATGSPYAYDALFFAGNTYDVNNTSGSAITISKTNLSDPSTYTGSSVTFSASYNHILTGMAQYTEVTYLTAGTTTELYHVEDVGAGGSTTYVHSGGASVDIHIFHVDYEPIYIDGLTLPNDNATIPISQVADNVYENP